MNNNKALPILFGIGITLYFLASYLVSKSSIDMFFITIGIMAILFGFYNENKKIRVSVSYFMAAFGVNIVQWLILIYIYYYNPVHVTTSYLLYLISGALIITLILVNQIRKKYLKSTEKGQEAKINMLKDKTKLILLITGIILTMGSLAGLIVYYAPIFLYGITLGLMVFIYGFYHEKRVSIPEKRNIAHMYLKKDNIAINYITFMGFLLLLQWIILIYFFRQISDDDWVSAMTLSINISVFFSIQIYLSDLKIPNYLKISNEKKEVVVGIGAIALFILIFGAIALKI